MNINSKPRSSSNVNPSAVATVRDIWIVRGIWMREDKEKKWGRSRREASKNRRREEK